MATTPRRTPRTGSLFLLAALAAASLFPLRCVCRCRSCDAFASYYITEGQNLTYISDLFGIGRNDIDSRILPPNNLTSKDSIQMGSRVKIPFSCGCVDGQPLARFSYRTVTGDTYLRIAEERYHNLTTVSSLRSANSYDVTGVPEGVEISVPVTCFCGDAGISREYGLFLTYPLRSGETLASVANSTGFSDLRLLRSYNPTLNFSVGQIMYVPTTGSCVALDSF